jgi:hypothetical protein
MAPKKTSRADKQYGLSRLICKGEKESRNRFGLSPALNKKVSAAEKERYLS